MAHITARSEGRTHTDHASLVYIYEPCAKSSAIFQHTAGKLMIWGMKLSEFRYVILLLSCERNVWADMPTRLAVKRNTSVNAGSLKGHN